MNVNCPPLISYFILAYNMIRDKLGLIIQRRVWDDNVTQHWLIVSNNIYRTFACYTHNLNIYLSPWRYSLQYFYAINHYPKKLDLIIFCFFESQQMGAPFKYTINLALDWWVSMPAAWSSSTLSVIVKPRPRGSYIFMGSPSPQTFPNST